MLWRLTNRLTGWQTDDVSARKCEVYLSLVHKQKWWQDLQLLFMCTLHNECASHKANVKMWNVDCIQWRKMLQWYKQFNIEMPFLHYCSFSWMLKHHQRPNWEWSQPLNTCAEGQFDDRILTWRCFTAAWTRTEKRWSGGTGARQSGARMSSPLTVCQFVLFPSWTEREESSWSWMSLSVLLWDRAAGCLSTLTWTDISATWSKASTLLFYRQIA